MTNETIEKARREALLAITHEIEAARPELALATPERQRLRMIGWIARARALAGALKGRAADEQVRRVARALQEHGQTWWPGSVLALGRTIPPQRVFPGTSSKTWDDVVEEAKVRSERSVDWADDRACTPRPHDATAMFAAACTMLAQLGGPLGVASPIDLTVTREAELRIPELARIAAELRWLRGTVPALAWGDAIGRLRGLIRALGRVGGPIAAILAPEFTPASWAQHLRRDPQREQLLGEMPPENCERATLLGWLVKAFDVLDTPVLVTVCKPLQPQILALQPELAARRDRRRFAALQHGLTAPTGSPAPSTSIPAQPHANPGEPRRVEQARALFQGRRALFISNRCFPRLEERLAKELGLECEAIASADSPRRRQALLQRIRRGTYDLVLVAHEFSGHADTELFAAACRDAGILYCAVGKGRFTRVVSCLLQIGHHAHAA